MISLGFVCGSYLGNSLYRMSELACFLRGRELLRFQKEKAGQFLNRPALSAEKAAPLKHY